MNFFKAALLSIFLILNVQPAFAVNPDEILDDPVLEQRARGLSENLRCLVCQNQSIDSSDADLARDLRVIVRERLVAGDSDGEVIDYVVDRYGEFVLLRPQFSTRNLILWGTPLLVLMLGAGFAIVQGRHNRRAPNIASLSKEEEARLEKLLSDGDEKSS